MHQSIPQAITTECVRAWFRQVRYMCEQHADSIKAGAKILELGCGTGIPGMCMRLAGGTVTLTEQPQLVPLLEKNLETNFEGDAAIKANELSVGEFPLPASLLPPSSASISIGFSDKLFIHPTCVYHLSET
jgi:hypothetical protein